MATHTHTRAGQGHQTVGQWVASSSRTDGRTLGVDVDVNLCLKIAPPSERDCKRDPAPLLGHLVLFTYRRQPSERSWLTARVCMCGTVACSNWHCRLSLSTRIRHRDSDWSSACEWRPRRRNARFWSRSISATGPRRRSNVSASSLALYSLARFSSYAPPLCVWSRSRPRHVRHSRSCWGQLNRQSRAERQNGTKLTVKLLIISTEHDCRM